MSRTYNNFVEGDIVRITGTCKTMGKTGEVVNIIKAKYSQSVSVSVYIHCIDKVLNYNPLSLELIKGSKKRNTMVKEDDISSSIITQSMTSNYDSIVTVTFLKGPNTYKEYAFACFDEVKEKDVVVCNTAHGMGLATVKNVYKKEIGTTSYINEKGEVYLTEPTQEIICKVDTSKFEARKEKRNKLICLEIAMAERLKVLQYMETFKKLAAKDTILSELLDEYNKEFLEDCKAAGMTSEYASALGKISKAKWVGDTDA